MRCINLVQVCLVLLLVHHCFTLPSILRIGGIFSETEEEQETAFRFAIERINDEANIIPGTTLVAHVERVHPQDSYSLEKKGKK